MQQCSYSHNFNMSLQVCMWGISSAQVSWGRELVKADFNLKFLTCCYGDLTIEVLRTTPHRWQSMLAHVWNHFTVRGGGEETVAGRSWFLPSFHFHPFNPAYPEWIGEETRLTLSRASGVQLYLLRESLSRSLATAKCCKREVRAVPERNNEPGLMKISRRKPVKVPW